MIPWQAKTVRQPISTILLSLFVYPSLHHRAYLRSLETCFRNTIKYHKTPLRSSVNTLHATSKYSGLLVLIWVSAQSAVNRQQHGHTLYGSVVAKNNPKNPTKEQQPLPRCFGASISNYVTLNCMSFIAFISCKFTDDGVAST